MPSAQIIPIIERKIYLVRGCKVMLDSDLAELYEVPTKVLNQAVRRNLDRFPEDFMFQLKEEEVENLRSQFVTSSSSHGGSRYLPYAFTEHGVAMLSSVLRSKRAVALNILIIRAFVRLREYLATHKDLARKLEDVERTQHEHSARIEQIYGYIQRLLEPAENSSKRRIGFGVGQELKSAEVIPIIERKIYLIRGCKVMLDSDLAELYEVPTKVLNQAVRRNLDRFPADFMFRLNEEELENWRSQIVTSNPGARMGLRRPPYAFTEHGVAMLSSVLTSKRAVALNILIIRAFVRLREYLATHKDLARKLEDVERTQHEHSAHIEQIYGYIQRLLEPAEESPKRRIGFGVEPE